MIVNISFQLDTDIPEDVAKLRKIVGLETAPEPAQKATTRAPKKAPTQSAKETQYDLGGTLPTPAAEVFKAVAEEVFPAVPSPASDTDRREALPYSGARREQAVHKATELVTTGQSQRVRDALGLTGAKRVSDLKDDQLEAFLAAVA